MSYRRVFILGGAALVLAACADVTSPGTQMHRGGAAAAAKSDSTSKAGPTTRSMDAMTTEECRTGVQVTSGRTDSTCADGGM